MDQRTKRENFYKKTVIKRLALSSGEGVGFSIVRSCLKKIGPQKNIQFLVWSAHNSPTLKISGFKTQTFKTEALAFKSFFRENHLLQIKSQKSPASWVKQAGQRALNGELSALVTGPVSKSPFKKYKAVGQTDLLKKLTKSKHVFMCFRGDFFNVILLTDHCPLKKVSLNKESLRALLDMALSARQFLPKNQREKPLGVLGLNPHAGEQTLLGLEEEKILKPVLKNRKDLEGPLSPDGAFLKKNWKKYSFFIALYHDQGLIPFKMIHNQKGFVQSLGLPFLRLGVDHGTGQGLKKKEISSESMELALKEALKILWRRGRDSNPRNP